ncbi:acyl-CoA dehydrogenase family protein [Hoeflea prorocentri]|uniref:Acyl-CoA dehydrogenase family protein n=1 Tax=Hoeflea prorocentri TaxID=1922333 RepID=A0A9X3ZGV1_9HYPH|nr:acyl-CoA dehydrogenase family protein [Hoeflea prorocentri]MCY6380130.1 acyl-CoA dehydrogenase family protein [Hoeflea prorocentri]MDA5397930.1 acyl-CoA dehydrogenase family protein [Hoeflea prorocentri]
MQHPFETPERSAFRQSFSKFVESEITPFADEWDEAGAIPADLHLKAGAMGMFGFGIDEAYGGLGFDDCFMRAAVCEELGKCGATGVGAALGARNISTGPIAALGSEELKQRVLPQILSGEECSSLGVTEPSGGSDVANLRATARRDGNEWVLNGTKTFITGGMTSRYFVIAARTGGPGLSGISLFFLEAGIAGFDRTALERKMGWWCSDQATLFFDECRLPADSLLGPEDRGFIAVMNNFNFERLALIAQSLGMAKLCLSQSIEYVNQRQTFGKRLIEHQVIAHKIADMSARIDSLEAYLSQICWMVNEGPMPVAEISKAKFLSTKILEYCASEAMQIFGGAGYLRGNPVERIYREVKVMAIGGGSEEIMKDLAIRQMGVVE